MRDKTRLIRTPNARITLFCEGCGKVDGPLPFGRGEVRLNYTTNGAWCEDCRVPVRQENPVDFIINFDDPSPEPTFVINFDDPVPAKTKPKRGKVGMDALKSRRDSTIVRINNANECGIIDGGTAEEMRAKVRGGERNDIEEVREELDAYCEAARDFERENGGL